MGIIVPCLCDCSATVTASITTSTGGLITLNADICPTCEAGGTLTFTELDANQTQIFNFTATTIRQSSCVSVVRTVLVVSGEGIFQDSTGTNPATFSLHLGSSPSSAQIFIQNPISGFTTGAFASEHISELTISDCPGE